jgi:DNA-directed RNA polymerase beta subunit
MPVDISSLVKKALQYKPKEKDDTKAKQQVYVMEDGDEYINPGIPGLVAASEKLLAINKGVADLDDREDFKFKRVFSTHDLVRERVVRDSGKLRRQMMFRLAKMRNLKPIHPGYFDSYVQGQIVGNPLASPLEEINPLHLLENSRRMTLMGPGGIGSDDAVTNDMQAVHGSTFGFLSPIEGPESQRSGIDTRFAWGTKLGSNGRLYQKFYDRRSGKYRYMSPEDLDGLTVKLPD